MKKLSSWSIKPRHKEILLMVSENKSKLFIAMFCMLIAAATTAATAYLVKPILDDIFYNKNTELLKIIPVAVVLIFLLKGISMFIQEYLMNYVGEDIIRRLRNRLYEKITDLPISFFQKEKTGELMSRITNDVNILKSMVSTAITNSLRDFFTIIGLTGVIFYRDWKMAIFAFFILPVAFYPIIQFGRKIRKISTGCQETMADLNSFLYETFTGNKIVKAFGMEEHEKKIFVHKTNNLFRLEMKAVIIRALSSPTMEFLGGVGIAFIIWYGGFSVISGSSTPGTFFSFMAAVLMLYDPVKKVSGLNNSIQQGLSASDRIFEILETESDIIEINDPIKIEKKAHTIIFDNVFFKYKKTMILKNIKFKVETGEIVALVGTSGGGKTSLVNLIPRFYNICNGEILIDNININNLTISSLRNQIAIVTQEPILFNDTIKNNIAYSKPDAIEDEIINAAKAAFAYDFIQDFREKFETTIGELGNRLSGGEKQRICIARALLKNAPILILDEATSALDTASEQIVQKALENLMKGRTTFVIAHRLSTIVKADKIFVIVNGEIIEQGSHEELISTKKEYYKLYNLQKENR